MKYKAHDYQAYATNFILEHPISAVFLDMGLGKSIITLSAIFDLCLDSFLVRKVLVIAPLRVARDTWPAEIHKWDHLHGLTYSVAVGTEAERKAALRQRVSVYIINRENVQWLIEESGIPFDYDMVVIDELSSFKSYQAKRFRTLLKVRPGIKRIVGLTGTPSSNGLMDLWAEFRILDMGKRLGRFITHYRNTFFRPDKRNGQVVFSYKPLPGAEEQIYDAISDITISMKAVDHLDMPECVHNDAIVTLSETERKAYDAMKQDLVISLKGEEIDAGNAAALVFQIHDRKLDMLNLHATFTKGTVEFRLFQFDAPADGKQNGLHAGQLKSYIQLCLALSQMAKAVRTASPKPQQNENPKYAMRTWLLRLGFIGDEFKTARELLTKRLDGDAAFRSGRAAA